jgi:hypothetical protein
LEDRGQSRDGKPKLAAKYRALGGFMPSTLVLMRKWNAWYRVLRHGKGFGFVNSVRYALWLARG